MPIFEYSAIDAKSEETTGRIEAANQADAINQLRTQGFFPKQVVEAGKGKLKTSKKSRKIGRSKSKPKPGSAKLFGGSTVKGKVLMIFTRQLATLIDSGLPLLRGLTVLAKQEPNPVLKRTITQLADSVQTGSTFSESLAQHPQIFNKLYINMVKAGELGGVLELVLIRLAEYSEKAQKLKNKIVAAMVYPVIVMVIAMSIMVFLLTVIVPKFEQIFTDMLGSKDRLPGLTKFVINLSGNLSSNIAPIAIGLVVSFVFYKVFSKSQGGRRFLDAVKLRMPLFGNVQRKSAISRFSRTLGTLVTSGVPILQALNITRDTAGNVVISQAVQNVHDAVKEGESIVNPLEASKVFPAMVISMVDVGEETGQLPEMLLKVADVYDDEVDNAVAALTSMLEPLMIVMLAVVVGVIVMALFLPMVEIIKGVAGG
ncbi:MAG: type II secretion system F family protein [Verrucomicrobia bacterium]|nr:MAG: pilus assembly protein PilC [Verrucomicrobiaceae bacterium TMED76]RCL33287.1 MAG: type II secretion system F family protein [Verrucomicrobiota bacterium]